MSIHLTVSEFGSTSQPANTPPRPTVRLNEVSAKRFFLSSPDEFFAQYAAHFQIEALQSIPESLSHALEFAGQHPECDMRLQTLASTQSIRNFVCRAEDLQVHYSIERLSVSRGLHKADESGMLSAQGDTWMDAVARAGRPPKESWSEFLQRFIETEARATLRLRKEENFELFLRAMAAADGLGVNWNALARKANISQPRAKLWGHFIAEHGLIDLIGVPEPRRKHRIVRRETVYWNAPGLAYWLCGSTLEESTSLLPRLRLNLLYLYLKDESGPQTIFHYRDTNGVDIPLLRISQGKREAICLCEDSGQLSRIRSHLRSIDRIVSLDSARVYMPVAESKHEPRLSAVHFSSF